MQPPPRSPQAAAAEGKLRRAMELHQQGRLMEAEPLYREVLAEYPSHPGGLQFLGILECQRGNLEEGLRLLDGAIGLVPGNVGMQYNRASILLEAGRPAEAIEGFDRVVAMRPDHAPAWHNRGLALVQLGRHADALPSFERALGVDANHVEGEFQRGMALQELGRNEEALRSFARVLELQPTHAGAMYGRGNALTALQRLDEAIASYDRAVQLAPGNIFILNNRGHALGRAGRHAEALKDLDHAIALDPARPEMLNNRGNILAHLKRFAEAAEAYGRALRLRPDYPEALSGSGYALTELKRHDEAIPIFEKLLSIRPDYPYAPGMLIYAKAAACDWNGLDEAADKAVAGIRAGQRIATPIALFSVSDSPDDHAKCSRIVIEDKHPGIHAPLWRGENYRHSRLRVAYVSADFNAHAVSLLTAGVFEHHDKSRFETVAISHGHDDTSVLRSRLMLAFERFFDVRDRSDSDIARVMWELEIDVAVDLTGLTGSGRPGIFAHRPCGIQVQHLGFAGTMGAPYYDYVLADRMVIPEDNRALFQEKIVYLPDTYLPNDNRRVSAAGQARREDWGLPQDGFVFCSFNNSYKFSRAMFDIWMRVLKTVEGSVLWLPAANDAAMRNLKREAHARGVDEGRIVFAAYAKAEGEHLARLALADLFLDTLPYNAHTTAADALWAGLPLLTTPGRTFPGRVAASLLTALGMPELIATDLADYEKRAIELASDRPRLAAIRERIKRQRETSPLFDTARFTRNLEAAYVKMMDRQLRGLRPESFAVEDTPA